MQTILLLHGAIGSSAQMVPLAEMLQAEYDVRTLDFSAHGGRPLPAEPLSIQLFAKDVLAFLADHGLSRVPVFGYSMGGYVAMYLARHYPEKIESLITLATKFHWDPETAEKEAKMLVPEKIVEKLPAFAASLEERHAPTDWKELLRRSSAMLGAMGQDNPLKKEDYAAISHQALVLLGDRDKMVTLEETMSVYKALPAGQMGMLPSTPHAMEQVNLPVLADLIKWFIPR